MKKLAVFLLLLVLFSAPVCLAHSGSLDSNGGHWDHSTGTYHYHSGIHAEGSSSGSSNGTYYRTTANVNMRSSASGSSTILQTIPEGSKAMYMGSRNGNWIKLSYNGKTGWCHANYLVKVTSAVITAKPTVRPTTKPKATVKPTKKPLSTLSATLLTAASIPLMLVGALIGGAISLFAVMCLGWLVSKILEWILGLFG